MKEYQFSTARRRLTRKTYWMYRVTASVTCFLFRESFVCEWHMRVCVYESVYVYQHIGCIDLLLVSLVSYFENPLCLYACVNDICKCVCMTLNMSVNILDVSTYC